MPRSDGGRDDDGDRSFSLSPVFGWFSNADAGSGGVLQRPAIRRPQKLRRRVDASAERAKERLELAKLLRVQFQRLELRVTLRSRWGHVVVVEHGGKGGELPCMH